MVLLNDILVDSMDTVLSIFMKRTYGWTSGPTGFLNITIPSLLGPFIGMFTKAYGVRFTAILGLTLPVPALGFSNLAQNDDIWSKVILCISLFVTGKSGTLWIFLEMMSIYFKIICSHSHFIRCRNQYLPNSVGHRDMPCCSDSPGKVP